MGYEPFIVDGRHESMIKALDFAEKLYCMISAGQYARWPMIILKSPKGWTAPEYQNIKIENTLRCHKDPLKGVLPIQKIDYISKWLEQYDKGDYSIRMERFLKRFQLYCLKWKKNMHGAC